MSNSVRQATSSPFHEAKGAIHLHTTFSDGGVGCDGLIATAAEVGLDYVAITDHMTLKGREQGFEGLRHGVHVIVGYEHHDRDGLNHYLVFGSDVVLTGVDDASDYVRAVREEGAIGFIAHPVEKRHYFRQYPPFPWTRWDADEFDGIEIWNQMSEWVESLRRIRSFVRILFPRRFIKRIPRRLLRKWDELGRTRFVSGIGGVDAHTIPVRLGPITIRVFPTKVELKGIRTHVLLNAPLSSESPETARTVLLEALRDGHGFVSNFRRGDATGARILLRDSDGEMHRPGRMSGTILPPVSIEVSVPLKGEINLIRNGDRVDSIMGKEARFAIVQNGLYRIEVFRRRRGWVYSNPFAVGEYPL